MNNKNVNELILKPNFFTKNAISVSQWLIGLVVGSVISLICVDKLTLINGMVIVLLAIGATSIILCFVYIKNINDFYKKYEEQYKYFIATINKENSDTTKNIKNIKKDIKKLKDNSLEYDIIDEW